MTSNIKLADVVALTCYRWMIPVLSEIAAKKGARFVELLQKLHLPRDSLVRTLEALREAQLVVPNPGHGHPLRPEYILTELGTHKALLACSIYSAQQTIMLPPTALTRWGLPLIYVIAEGENRFNGFSRALPKATSRAISQGLRGLTDQNLVKRAVVDTYPPTAHYGLTFKGLFLSSAT